MAEALDITSTPFLVSQGKGGVGKSVIAALLLQYLTDKGYLPKGFDTDPVNATLSHFTDPALDIARVDVATDGKVDTDKFTAMLNLICNPQARGPWVIDTGATIFLPWWHYVDDIHALDMLAARGRNVVVHCPVMGGQEQLDTLNGLASVCGLMPEQSVVVWLNDRNYPVDSKEKRFEDFKVVTDNAAKIRGVVRFNCPKDSERGKTLGGLMLRSETFNHACANGNYVAQHVIGQIRGPIWAQLDECL